MPSINTDVCMTIFMHADSKAIMLCMRLTVASQSFSLCKSVLTDLDCMALHHQPNSCAIITCVAILVLHHDLIDPGTRSLGKRL